MTKKSKTKNGASWIVVLIIGVCVGLGLGKTDLIKIDEPPKQERQTISPLQKTSASRIEVCFTPPSGCASVIVREISHAKESIYVQAYGMSSAPIVNALIKAHLRGVEVKVLLDRSNLKQAYSKMRELRAEQIEIGIDKVPGIAHNKVMIIDKRKVITGSFNFTSAADSRNAENVIIVEDTVIAKQYLQNWNNRKQKSMK
jgi:phospholipase D